MTHLTLSLAQSRLAQALAQNRLLIQHETLIEPGIFCQNTYPAAKWLGLPHDCHCIIGSMLGPGTGCANTDSLCDAIMGGHVTVESDGLERVLLDLQQKHDELLSSFGDGPLTEWVRDRDEFIKHAKATLEIPA